MTHLLDSNAWIAHLRGKSATVRAKIQMFPPSDLGLSTVVPGELYFGAYHSGPNNVAANLVLVEQLVLMFPLVSYCQRSADEYGKIRQDLGSRGLLIGPNDLLIAATALANSLTLVTHNTREFSRVPGLKLEDWEVP